MIEIRSKKEGFRRAGGAHSVAPKQYPDDAFTEKQLEQLRAESMLTVTQVDGDKAAEEEPAKPAGKAAATWTKAEIKAAVKETESKATKVPDILDRDK